MSSETSSKKVTLKSSDGETFEVEETVVIQSQTIKHMIEDECADNAIPLPNVSGKTLSKVIEYCRKHHHVVEEAGSSSSSSGDKDTKDTLLQDWDAKFVNVDLDVLFDLILAANFLDIKSLLDLTSQATADKIKDKKPEEIRKIFNINNDFTPEEEAELRKQNQWAFE